ncbi:MAG: hypothetical protein DRJ15_11150 [Bacteroidetes bacterium]|nr:MAG: hypothetical protein DRJ15_11150 [Bacteroidota bacterium]
MKAFITSVSTIADVTKEMLLEMPLHSQYYEPANESEYTEIMAVLGGWIYIHRSIESDLNGQSAVFVPYKDMP